MVVVSRDSPSLAPLHYFCLFLALVCTALHLLVVTVELDWVFKKHFRIRFLILLSLLFLSSLLCFFTVTSFQFLLALL